MGADMLLSGIGWKPTKAERKKEWDEQFLARAKRLYEQEQDNKKTAAIAADLLAMAEDTPRDITPLLTFDGTVYVLSGGMSWGDNPSDSFQVFIDICDMIPEKRLMKAGFWK